MPSPAPRASPAPPPVPPTGSDGGPTAWTTEQQQEFIRALMSAPSGPTAGGPAPSLQSAGLNADTGDDPMAAMFSALTQMSGQGAPGMGSIPGMPPMAGAEVPVAQPRSLFVKLRPLLHLLASWILLAFFALKMEPQAYAEQTGVVPTASGTLERWAELARRAPKSSFAIQAVVGLGCVLLLHSSSSFS